ncbi:hypothetical protein PTSG_01492 [Salpingoeca rosetta]|uniref:DM10 domain-containing protein n=1 Tax=Salpingoeca rosetta (strain ATCC 50818 / BSB-021) TaxID=946362 RepID=F2U0H9_SALR5|nr:uncharacterized protein PTSG_01492 [Salpingoeca rosetta]EGD80907.1 hypothetical protein PTSG_01492 [Salpingoeca rosetta]|eukprot:XP_004997468.1 hypothetical protein PTSG_01492 [Salpingoeca rosetta]
MAFRQSTLPPLPGNSFNTDQAPKPRKQQLTFANGVPVVLSDSDKAKRVPSSTLRSDPTVAKQPAWLVFDRQTLSFDAYFQEAVHERREEHFRVRKCKIFFFPEDDTLEVIEPPKADSGLPQGKLLRRHRVPKPAPRDDEFYEVEDFNVGKEITIYGRTFLIYDCDKFTRDFLTKLGVSVGQPLQPPTDPYSTLRENAKATQVPLRPYERQDKLKQFLENDRKVLRFYCLWDDSDSEFGEKRYLVLHYFLADDTLEIREVQQPNSGRDGPGVFLRRQKLPKDHHGQTKVPGAVTSRTLLNVFAPSGLQGRHILDSLHTGSGESAHYTDKDLEIGAEINVYGRTVLLCDCDDFTKAYYKEKYGMDHFEPIHVEEPEDEIPRMPTPPHTGFGTEEDSLVSVNHLILKPPKRQFKKWFEEGSRSLQFKARMDTDNPVDMDREFAITFYLADDTLAIFESRKRNSGIAGGKFLERCQLKVPGTSRAYGVEDFRLGAVIEANKHRFLLTDASDFTFTFMEQNKMPESDVDAVSAKARQSLRDNAPSVQAALQGADSVEHGVLPLDVFEGVIVQHTADLTLQEIRTLARHFAEGGDARNNGINYQRFTEEILHADA